jgi:hypothetical protein
MRGINQLLSILIPLAVILLAAGCSNREAISEQGSRQQTGSNSEDASLAARQQTDETVLVQLGRTYAHGFPEGSYQEYALNNLGDQAITVLLSPADNSNLALAIFNAADKTDAVLRLDEGTAGEAETTHFTPEVGLNYLLLVYEVRGQAENTRSLLRLDY